MSILQTKAHMETAYDLAEQMRRIKGLDVREAFVARTHDYLFEEIGREVMYSRRHAPAHIHCWTGFEIVVNHRYAVREA